MPGERELDQNAVHQIIGVQCRDDVQQFLLPDRRRKDMLEACHAKLDGFASLVADINLACGIAADQHDRQAGCATRAGFEGWNCRRDPVRKAFGIGFTVDYRRAHTGPLNLEVDRIFPIAQASGISARSPMVAILIASRVPRASMIFVAARQRPEKNLRNHVDSPHAGSSFR